MSRTCPLVRASEPAIGFQARGTAIIGHCHPRMSIVISRRHRLDLAELLHQQCWCWGCDIKRSDGNLLGRYGARRVPPETRRRDCSTAYHVVCGDDTRIALWGS
jgi:hypothetical protein